MRARSREEFEAVFRAHYASVFGSVLLIVHDRGRAEEVTQDAFLKLYERWTAVNWVVEYPPAWVHQVAVRAAIRRATREKVVPVAEPVDRAITDVVPDVDLVNAIGVAGAQAAGGGGPVLPGGPPGRGDRPRDGHLDLDGEAAPAPGPCPACRGAAGGGG